MKLKVNAWQSAFEGAWQIKAMLTLMRPNPSFHHYLFIYFKKKRIVKEVIAENKLPGI
jgi:hypothetical protein